MGLYIWRAVNALTLHSDIFRFFCFFFFSFANSAATLAKTLSQVSAAPSNPPATLHLDTTLIYRYAAPIQCANCHCNCADRGIIPSLSAMVLVPSLCVSLFFFYFIFLLTGVSPFWYLDSSAIWQTKHPLVSFIHFCSSTSSILQPIAEELFFSPTLWFLANTA